LTVNVGGRKVPKTGPLFGLGNFRRGAHIKAHRAQPSLGQLSLKQQQLRNPAENINRDRLDSSQIICCYIRRIWVYRISFLIPHPTTCSQDPRGSIGNAEASRKASISALDFIFETQLAVNTTSFQTIVPVQDWTSDGTVGGRRLLRPPGCDEVDQNGKEDHEDCNEDCKERERGYPVCPAGFVPVPTTARFVLAWGSWTVHSCRSLLALKLRVTLDQSTVCRNLVA